MEERPVSLKSVYICIIEHFLFAELICPDPGHPFPGAGRACTGMFFFQRPETENRSPQRGATRDRAAASRHGTSVHSICHLYKALLIP